MWLRHDPTSKIDEQGKIVRRPLEAHEELTKLGGGMGKGQESFCGSISDYRWAADLELADSEQGKRGSTVDPAIVLLQFRARGRAQIAPKLRHRSAWLTRSTGKRTACEVSII